MMTVALENMTWQLVRFHFQLLLLCFGNGIHKYYQTNKMHLLCPQLLIAEPSQLLFNQAPFPHLHKGCCHTNESLFFTTSYKFVKIQWQDWGSNYKWLKYSIWLEQTFLWMSFIEPRCILGHDMLILYNLHILNKISPFFFCNWAKKRKILIKTLANALPFCSPTPDIIMTRRPLRNTHETWCMHVQ